MFTTYSSDFSFNAEEEEDEAFLDETSLFRDERFRSQKSSSIVDLKVGSQPYATAIVLLVNLFLMGASCLLIFFCHQEYIDSHRVVLSIGGLIVGGGLFLLAMLTVLTVINGKKEIYSVGLFVDFLHGCSFVSIVVLLVYSSCVLFLWDDMGGQTILDAHAGKKEFYQLLEWASSERLKPPPHHERLWIEGLTLSMLGALIISTYGTIHLRPHLAKCTIIFTSVVLASFGVLQIILSLSALHLQPDLLAHPYGWSIYGSIGCGILLVLVAWMGFYTKICPGTCARMELVFLPLASVCIIVTSVGNIFVASPEFTDSLSFPHLFMSALVAFPALVFLGIGCLARSAKTGEDTREWFKTLDHSVFLSFADRPEEDVKEIEEEHISTLSPNVPDKLEVFIEGQDHDLLVVERI